MPQDDGLIRLAKALNRAWAKYSEVFGVAPHGTVKQLAAMLEFCPEARVYIQLYERQREDMLTR
jgi:hypothetical protein